MNALDRVLWHESWYDYEGLLWKCQKQYDAFKLRVPQGRRSSCAAARAGLSSTQSGPVSYKPRLYLPFNWWEWSQCSGDRIAIPTIECQCLQRTVWMSEKSPGDSWSFSSCTTENTSEMIHVIILNVSISVKKKIFFEKLFIVVVQRVIWFERCFRSFLFQIPSLLGEPENNCWQCRSGELPLKDFSFRHTMTENPHLESLLSLGKINESPLLRDMNYVLKDIQMISLK